ncbi:MAG: class I SAM-dependent methyltransferase [Anaerolineales bacterium]|nr:class I SAM-dependent methyltransferase [Anaerolineales bacterium]
MKKKYDDIIAQHYQEIARDHGFSSTSTMADKITRKLETEAILQFVDESIRIQRTENKPRQFILMDVGCGNGYTLEILLKAFPNLIFYGIEKSDELRSLATTRFSEAKNITILEGDVRDNQFAQGLEVDILICQRVLINLLDFDDQRIALENIINSVRSPGDFSQRGGKLLFLESFQDTLERLNEARSEFELPPISSAYHNLYLPNNFFDRDDLNWLNTEGRFTPSNFLSTHYYITRVLHPILKKGKEFKRNSEFVKFFSQALLPYSGDYSPIKLNIFEKI